MTDLRRGVLVRLRLYRSDFTSIRWKGSFINVFFFPSFWRPYAIPFWQSAVQQELAQSVSEPCPKRPNERMFVAGSCRGKCDLRNQFVHPLISTGSGFREISCFHPISFATLSCCLKGNEKATLVIRAWLRKANSLLLEGNQRPCYA